MVSSDGGSVADCGSDLPLDNFPKTQRDPVDIAEEYYDEGSATEPDEEPSVEVPSSQAVENALDGDGCDMMENETDRPHLKEIETSWGSMNDSQFIQFVNKLSERVKSQKSEESSEAVESMQKDRKDGSTQSTEEEVYTQHDQSVETGDNVTIEIETEIEPETAPPPRTSSILLNTAAQRPRDSDVSWKSSSFGFNTMDEDEILAQLKQKEGAEAEPNPNPEPESSTISKRSTEYEDPEGVFARPPSGPSSQGFEFGDYVGYFENKQRKQQAQDKEYAEFVGKAMQKTYPPIFDGCVIYVNGKTHPDISQIHKLVVLYGGKFRAYLGAKGNATHIIAENLTPRKRVEFRNYKVVKPEWIVESISAGTLLPWSDYALINNDYGQKRLGFKRQGEALTKPEEEEETAEDNFDVSQLSAITDPEPPLEDVSEVEAEGTVDPKYGHMTAKDPRFLEFFFAKSRLHHLSTWKMELRSKFLLRTVDVLTKRNKRSPEQKVVLHVDFDCFFATVSALKHQPPVDISKVPLCVTNGSNGSDVASCNYLARAKGCSNGMWLGRARKMCPELVCLPYMFDEYEKISQIFYDTLLEYDVDSLLPVSVDEALLDVTSLSKTTEPMEIMRSIKEKVFERTHCSVSCGAGPNVLMAKIALRRGKPDGIFEVKEKDSVKVMSDIQFRSLPGIGCVINSKLENELGAKNVPVARVREMAKGELVRILGIKTGETVFNYCRGIDDTSIDILSDPDKFTRKSLSIDINWGIRFDDDLQVEEFLGNLGKALCKRLIEARVSGSQITLKLATRHPDAPREPAKFLGMGHCEFVSKSSKFGINTREVGLITTELKYLWRVLGVDPKELRGVAATMTKLVGEENKDDVMQMRLPFKSGSGTTKRPIPVIEAPPRHPPRPPPPQSTPTKCTMIDLNEDEINWDVFKELPKEIQKEIKQELKRRELQWSPRKRTRRKNDIADLVSPKKKKKKKEKRTNVNSGYGVTITREMVEESSRLTFQGIPLSRYDEIREKTRQWVDSTAEAGPDGADVDLFMDMMLKLVDVGEPLKYLGLLEMLAEKIGRVASPAEEWAQLIAQLRSMFTSIGQETLLFDF